MASGGSADNALAEFVGAILQLVFHLSFPLIVVTLCGVSFVLAFALHAPEFGLWAGLAMVAIGYAKTNLWVALGIGAFVLISLPLAWVFFREQQIQLSRIILQWVIAALVTGGTFWLRSGWPYENSGWQIIVYGIILFAGWSALIEATLGTLAIVAHVRRNRPRPVKPPPQQPHGAARVERRSRDEPETI
jgi:hypothetical protein